MCKDNTFIACLLCNRRQIVIGLPCNIERNARNSLLPGFYLVMIGRVWPGLAGDRRKYFTCLIHRFFRSKQQGILSQRMCNILPLVILAQLQAFQLPPLLCSFPYDAKPAILQLQLSRSCKGSQKQHHKTQKQYRFFHITVLFKCFHYSL